MDGRRSSCPRDTGPCSRRVIRPLTPDTGSYYAWADPKPLLKHLQEKRERSARKTDSPFAGFPSAWYSDSGTLPCLHSRIVFRDISRSTDTRTMRVALLPPKCFLTNKGPYLLLPRGTIDDQAFLLGVLSSIPLDWYARRFVETSLNFFILNPFPIPRPRTTDPLRRRVIEIAARLATTDDRFGEWASHFKLVPKILDEDEKSDLIAELDAAASLLYGSRRRTWYTSSRPSTLGGTTRSGCERAGSIGGFGCRCDRDAVR